MSFLVFMIIRAIPVNPDQVILVQQATEEAIEAMTIKLGQDKPWYTQFFVYLKVTLTGDLGESLRTRAPESEEIGPYLAGTLTFANFVLVIAVFIGINSSIVSVWYKNS